MRIYLPQENVHNRKCFYSMCPPSFSITAFTHFLKLVQVFLKYWGDNFSHSSLIVPSRLSGNSFAHSHSLLSIINSLYGHSNYFGNLLWCDECIQQITHSLTFAFLITHMEEEEEEEAVEVEEVEIINVIQQKPPPLIERISRTEVRSELRDVPQPAKMDTRFFGELLAEVYRKNCDIHSCISEHVSKIHSISSQLTSEQDFSSIPTKELKSLTKQQIRYLLQTRLTADKSMRLLLSTFSSLREELMHMSDDLRRLESEKESLERDLTFKADQAKQYDSLLEAVRENNRQLQTSLKEASSAQRSLESQLMSSRSTDSNREFKLKELEGRMRAMEKENEMLRQKVEEHLHDRYRNQYPILGLLSDDYQATSPVKEAKTIVIERTGEMIKQVKNRTEAADRHQG
uniref:POF1B actin binding protein n=1 Tax=Sphaeramia orbicularis TaxID=375764 RepID=A0A672YQ17_9TELE